MTMFDGPKISREAADKLFEGKFDEAMAYIDSFEFPTGESKRRANLINLYNDVTDCVDRSYGEGINRISLSHIDDNAIPINSRITDYFSLEDGLYLIDKGGGRFSEFSNLKNIVPSQVLDILRTAQFDHRIPTHSDKKMRVMSDVFFCTEHRNLFAFAGKGASYDRFISGRVAKACAINFKRDANKVIEKAYILPVPHHTKNYYHVMSEMIYPIKLCSDRQIPIIYCEDNFGLIEFVSDRMNINKNLFMSFKDVRNTIVKKSVTPICTSFTWDKGVFDFFRDLAGERGNPFLKLYISRRLRGRGPRNERDLEDALQAKGFTVVFPETLSVRDQANFFSNAKIVIAPHGAGITNIAFCKSGTPLIEMFNHNFVARNYYLRSRHNAMPYLPILIDDEVDVDGVLESITRNFDIS